MDEETVKTLVGIDKQVLIDFLKYLHWYMNDVSSWWTLTNIKDSNIVLKYEKRDRWGDYESTLYYSVPWDHVFNGQIGSFIEQEDEKLKAEKQLRGDKGREEQLLKEKQKAEKKELEERQLFERLKEKYETAK